MKPTVSQFDLLNKSPDELRGLAGKCVDGADVRTRLSWLVEVASATQADFAHDLVHREPCQATFHATLAAILKEEPLPSPTLKRASPGSYLERWTYLEMVACMRKLMYCFVELPALCTQHRIYLDRSTKGARFHFKFPHQDKPVDCVEGMVFQLLAEHGLARSLSVHYDAEVPPSARAVVTELLDAEARKRAK